MNTGFQFIKKCFYINPIFLYALMMLLGVFSGFWDQGYLQSFGIFIAEVFIRLFKCVSLPIIFLSIMVTLSGFCGNGAMPKIWGRTLLYTMTTTIIAASLSCFLYYIIRPESIVTEATEFSLQSNTDLPSDYFSFLLHLIPTNLLSPFLENQVLTVLFIGIVMGMAIRFIPDLEARETITQMVKGAHGVFMVMTRWIIAIIPLGLFGFITTTVMTLRSGMDMTGLGKYLLVIVLANLLQGFVVLPLWIKSKGFRPFLTMRAILPALSLAFFSKSSVGTLPVTMDLIETKLSVNPQISRFVLPLCTTMNMNGCAAFIFTTVIYLMQNQGIIIQLPTMILWIFVATLAAIGNAGIPMGCFFLSTSLLASMNVSITLMAVILPFYTLIDMLETALNVWSDSCVTLVVDAQSKNSVL